MIGYLAKFFLKHNGDNGKSVIHKYEGIYPLDELKKYVGQLIEVEYTNQDTPRRAIAKLYCDPNPEFFYLSEREVVVSLSIGIKQIHKEKDVL